jgi:hypothetical protein
MQSLSFLGKLAPIINSDANPRTAAVSTLIEKGNLMVKFICGTLSQKCLTTLKDVFMALRLSNGCVIFLAMK